VGGCNVGLHNLFYPDNALIYRRERLVIYARGMTILCVYAHILWGCNRYLIVIIIWPIWLDVLGFGVLCLFCEAVGVSRLGAINAKILVR
jgi:hypothetical protein